ncbi:MAG: DUF1684 domain-containing protein [Acidimicrobiia bacterium]
MDQLTEFRKHKDEFFRESHHSPIPHEARHTFAGLNYYAPNPDLVFKLNVEEADGSELSIGTTDGATRTYRRVGKVSFEVNGEQATLTLFDTGHPGWFLPFRDSTSGKETYGAGRYLDLEPNPDGTVTIDFNYAYNPSCVYDEAYSCPLPPPENWLQVPIEAGEQNFDPGEPGSH